LFERGDDNSTLYSFFFVLRIILEYPRKNIAIVYLEFIVCK